jgi:hypothetical protein
MKPEVEAIAIRAAKEGCEVSLWNTSFNFS